MIAFVLDCSIAVAWLFDDEATPAIDSLARLFPVCGAWNSATSCHGRNVTDASPPRILPPISTSWSVCRSSPIPKRKTAHSERYSRWPERRI